MPELGIRMFHLGTYTLKNMQSENMGQKETFRTPMLPSFKQGALSNKQTKEKSEFYREDQGIFLNTLWSSVIFVKPTPPPQIPFCTFM